MKVEWRLFVGGGLLMALNAAIYVLLTSEEAGATMMTLSFVALLFVGAYIALQARRHGTRPEDQAEPEPDEGADVGYFPSSSIWPFVAACGVTVMAVGLVFGMWLTLIGGLLLGTATLGYALEANAKA